MKDDKKQEEIHKKFHTFLGDVAADLLDEEEIEEIHKIVTLRLRKVGATTSLPGLKAFLEGFEFGVHCANNDKEVPALAGLHNIVKSEEEKVAKKVDEALPEDKK